MASRGNTYEYSLEIIVAPGRWRSAANPNSHLDELVYYSGYCLWHRRGCYHRVSTCESLQNIYTDVLGGPLGRALALTLRPCPHQSCFPTSTESTESAQMLGGEAPAATATADGSQDEDKDEDSRGDASHSAASAADAGDAGDGGGSGYGGGGGEEPHEPQFQAPKRAKSQTHPRLCC